MSGSAARTAAIATAFKGFLDAKIAEGWRQGAAEIYAGRMVAHEASRGRLDLNKTVAFLSKREAQCAERLTMQGDEPAPSFAPARSSRTVSGNEQRAQMIAEGEGLSLANARAVVKARFPQANIRE